MSESAGGRSDYRERIRLARERVDAVERESAQATHFDNVSTGRRFQPLSVPVSRPSQMQGRPQATESPHGPPGPSAWTSDRSQEQLEHRQTTSHPPPRPYRPEQNSWFATGGAPGTDDSRRSAQPASRRQMNSSRTQTDSSYSQSETPDGSNTAGPSRASYVSHPSHHTSHQSSVSSIGDIPDFPVPQHEQLYQTPSSSTPQPVGPAHPRRTSNHAPPPSVSARRAASSLYSQHHSYVSPIPEESPQFTPRDAHFSMTAPSDHALDSVNEDVEHTFLGESSDGSNRNTLDPDSDFAQYSPGLVRQASLGRKAKPSLTLVRSGSSTAKKGVSPQSMSEQPTPTAARHQTARTASRNLTPGFVPSPPSPVVQNSTNVSPQHIGQLSTASPARSISPLSPLTPVVERIIGGLEKGGALAQGVTAPQILEADASPSQTQSVYTAKKEDRISTTSLADLIRRATRVRTNLDRGKTASRLGMLDMFGRSKDKLNTYEKPDRGSMSDSMSGMIGWVPPHPSGPGGPPVYTDKALEEGEPTRQAVKQRVRRNRRKRCCGMPTWLFFLVLVLIIGCIAAAIIVPVELLVVPRQNESTGATLANCPSTNRCQNGGITVVSQGLCSCACVNGHTGVHCESAPPSDGSCAQDASTIEDAPGNITVGSAIPRLINGSSMKFGISLNVTKLVGAFSHLGMSCGAENSLVTFNGRTARRSEPSFDKNHAGPVPTATATLAPSNVKRDDPSAIVTSSGIVFAPSATATGVNGTGTPPATNSSGNSAEGSSAFYDFARVALLFILQETGDYTTAINAQKNLTTILMKSPISGTIQLNSTVSIDVGRGSIVINEHSYGGRL